MHSHHSHSGEYVAHGSDTLDGITQRAKEMGFEVFCLTEHMPRLDEQFIYPEEHDRKYTTKDLEKNFDEYHKHARRIQLGNVGDKTKFLVGMEVEGINEAHIEYTNEIKNRYDLDMVVGSVHFVKGIPIDFDRGQFLKAVEVCGGLRQLFLEYFQLQYKVISGIHPEVIGHFDLIRLFTQENDVDDTTGKLLKDVDLEHDWPEVWEQIKTNLLLANSYNALIELNSSAIRKQWQTPYPKLDVSNAVKAYNDGRFCLSDDSHSIAQVGLNYHKVLEYIVNDLKLERIFYLDIDISSGSKVISIKEKSIEEVKANEFWKQY
jgi:histidinol-phosphatase (PHP family)